MRELIGLFCLFVCFYFEPVTSRKAVYIFTEESIKADEYVKLLLHRERNYKNIFVFTVGTLVHKLKSFHDAGCRIHSTVLTEINSETSILESL